MNANPVDRRRRRFAQLLDLAQNYRGWSRRELARALGRDPTKLIPGSGVPKIDIVVDLAQALDWGVEDVIDFFWEISAAARSEMNLKDEFDALDQAARDAHRSGQFRLMIDIARHAWRKAATPEQRARACNREAGGWDGLGRYQNSLKAIQRGLIEGPVNLEFRRVLQSNLANAYYSLWSLVEARAIASDLVAWFDRHPAQSARDRKTFAFGLYVLGHTCRRLIATESERASDLASEAQAALLDARDRYQQLSVDLDDPSLEGIANTCRGGLLEVDVVLRRRTPEVALETIASSLDTIGDVAQNPLGDRLESLGWWCIFGCNIALRHLTDDKSMQKYMAVFTNKADEIADRLENWAIRERVFSMEHAWRERNSGNVGIRVPGVIDREDVKIITGTMSRFPSFRATGLRILESANLVTQA